MTDTQLNTEVRKVNGISRNLMSLMPIFPFLVEGIYKDSENGGSISNERWQAFIDWTKQYRKMRELDPEKLSQLNISSHDVPVVRRAAFKIIRQRNWQSRQTS